MSPLVDGQLKESIAALADRLGFKNSGVYVMDGSKRSSHSNAYFTGLGKAKRIVLFDTLVEDLGEKGLLAVLAHEIGHSKLHHLIKGLIYSSALSLFGFWLLSLALGYQPFYQAFGFYQPSSYALLILFSLASGPVMYFISPLFSLLSRKHEYEADYFAAGAVNNSNDLETALLNLSKKNLSNLIPHPWYSFFSLFTSYLDGKN